jgi:hypothetical protein
MLLLMKLLLLLSLFLPPIPILAQTATPTIIDQCAALLPADRPVPTGADAPTIRFAAPADGDTIYGSVVPLTIETTNFALNDEARHWHLWVNGQLTGMVYQQDAIIDLAPGTYQVCASLGNTDHADLGMPAGITITVQQPAAGTPTPTLSVSREEATVQPEPEVTPLQLLIVAGVALLAAVAGWWLGARLGRRSKP